MPGTGCLSSCTIRLVDPLILTVAPTGADTPLARVPHLPVTPEAIGADAARCLAAGAAIVHVHVRDADGRASDDPGRIRAAVEAVRSAAPGMLVNVSTAGSATHDEGRRLAAVDAGGDLASLDCGSMNFGSGVFLNPPLFLEALAARMLERGVRPELEVFDTSHVATAIGLRDKGLLREPLWFGLVLGVPGGIPASAENLLHMVRQLPPGSRWSAIVAGRHQLALTTVATAIGGHVRVGFEDAIYERAGVLAAANEVFVARAARIAAELGRAPATPDEVRALLGL